jgi:DNA polymerase-3 subunit gamma/tau
MTRASQAAKPPLVTTDSPESLFGDSLPETPAPEPGYRVLARKYRPGDFAGLIGQQAMVQTLANAIARGRLAQAWLLTGVRGVGKTSTARIIARALNCIGIDGSGGPTIEPCGQCTHCRQIAAGSHMDVIEMDAASNTSVDDVREIIESVRYASVSARYKIYIIDEVHMLSKSAFNALLKTLEEPPAHVKFIFATTEVQKLPVTVLSRCQRFDLKRVPAETLLRHFASIAEAEGITAEPDALALIARAAEGSVRDGLSILDQAIAHSEAKVTAETVRDMLGLADRGAVRALMAHALAGDAPATLAALAAQHELGRDPESVLKELLDLVHLTTRARLAPLDATLASAEERAQIEDWASRLDFPALHRLWQLLLKGLAETQAAPNALQAAEMALLRLIHASELPDPGALIRSLIEGRMPAPAAPPSSAPPLNAPHDAPHTRDSTPLARASAPPPADLAGVVTLLKDGTEPLLAHHLEHGLRLISYTPETPRLVLGLGNTDRASVADLAPALRRLTGQDWRIEYRESGGAATLAEAEAATRAARLAAAAQDALVTELRARYPDAELVDVLDDERKRNAQSR